MTEKTLETLFSDALERALTTVLAETAKQAKPSPARLGVSVTEAAKLLGISRNQAYELAKRDDFPSLNIGGRIVISLRGLEDWVDRQAAGAGVQAS